MPLNTFTIPFTIFPIIRPVIVMSNTYVTMGQITWKRVTIYKDSVWAFNLFFNLNISY